MPQKGPEELIITAQTGNSVALLPKYRDPVAPEMSLLASRGEQISCKSSRWGVRDLRASWMQQCVGTGHS